MKIFKQEYNVIIFFPFYLCFTTQISFYSVVYPYGWQFQKIFWVADFHFRWQISHFLVTLGGNLPPIIMPENKNAAMILVNHYCKNGRSQRESNPQLALRRRLLYPFNYENKCRIFRLFSSFGYGRHIYESNHFHDELPFFLILTSMSLLLQSNSKLFPFYFQWV